MRFDRAPDDPLSLVSARVHEAEGLGRRSFAIFQAARQSGPLVWILPAYAAQMPFLPGLPEGVGQRLHVVRPTSEIDLLWSVEEALRSKGVGLVIAEPEKSLSLTAGRRLQLAAEAGQTTGLMLIREGQGNNATETRWYCKPVPGEQRDSNDSTAHHWKLNKNKKGILTNWIVHWNGKTAAIHMVSAVGERYCAAETSP